jgi:hypothetical protein
MDKKYKAQITIEVDLETDTHSVAETRGILYAEALTMPMNFGPWYKPTTLISCNVIQDPPEQEWLENLVCVK